MGLFAFNAMRRRQEEEKANAAKKEIKTETEEPIKKAKKNSGDK